ncbi:MAG: hypothetical protein JXA07_08700 [Spirochaetes bacterium]|nr:hypothetical protein [Spirochaetota bacterium]
MSGSSTIFRLLLAGCGACVIALTMAVTSCTILPAAVTLTDKLPRETDVPGWVITGRYRTSRMNRIRQISPVYAEYEPAEMAVAEYRRLSDETRAIRAELIRFRSPLDSFGLYGRERGFDPAGRFTGDDAYARDGSLFFRKGRYYLKIIGTNLGEEDTDAPGQFRSVVANNLEDRPGDGSLPDSLFIFSDGRSTRDIVHYKSGVDSIPGMKDVTLMRRVLAGKKHDIMYLKTATAFDAEQEFQKVMRNGEDFMLSNIGTLPTAVRIVSDHHCIVISHYKQWIFGVMDADTINEGNRLIIYLYGELKARLDRNKK